MSVSVLAFANKREVDGANLGSDAGLKLCREKNGGDPYKSHSSCICPTSRRSAAAAASSASPSAITSRNLYRSLCNWNHSRLSFYGLSSPVHCYFLSVLRLSFFSDRKRECVWELEIPSPRGLFSTSPMVYNEAPYWIYLPKKPSLFLFGSLASSKSFVEAVKRPTYMQLFINSHGKIKKG
jgi:hypothetical protein